MSMKLEHPVLMIVRGLPGSGKTYFVDAFQKSNNSFDSIILDPDATDYEGIEYKEHVKAQTTEGVDPKLHPYRFLRAQAYSAITAHKLILWNQPFTNLEMLRKVTDRLEEYATENNTTLPILIVEVDIDHEVAKQRVMQRKSDGGHGPSEGTFNRFINEYATAAHIGYNIVTIKGLDDPAQTVPIVAQALQRLI